MTRLVNIQQFYASMKLDVPKKGLSLNHNSQQGRQSSRASFQLDKDILGIALNRSYIKRMADSTETISVEELVDTVGDFISSFLPKINYSKELEEYWVIVALNEQSLNHSTGSGGLCGMGGQGGKFDPASLKLYQLFIGLGSHEFRFQSLESPKQKFIVNVDTVEVEFLPAESSDPRYRHRIRILVDKKYDLDFYFTTSTLPFGMQDNLHSQDATKILANIYEATAHKVKLAIEDSKGLKYHIAGKTLPSEDYFECRYAAEQQFVKYAETGDVLLFKDNHTFAKVQRFFTNSEVDHVGVVFRDERYGLCIFESNGGTGVSLAMWNQLVRYKWFENIEGIFWRRLNMQNKPEDFEDRVREFVKINLHKEYGISLGKLFSSEEIVYDNPEDEKNRTYFCSELVAALYKHMGLLEKEKPSSTYIPKDFSDKGAMNMINNTALSPERRIIFNESVLKENYRFYR